MVNGYTASFAGITTTNSYNNRLQPGTLSASAPSQPVFNMSYDFHLGTADNGNVWQIVNNRDTTRTVNYDYDQLNRIKSAVTASTSGPNCWGQLFGHMNGGTYVSGFDPWANLKEITVSQCSAPTLSLIVDGNNHVTGSGYSYDAAGNMTSDGLGHSPVYDAENRIKTAAGVNYTYDGDGKRVKKDTGKLYWTGTGSDPLDESDLSGTINEEYVFFGGKRIARLDLPSGTVHYYFSDHLGSASVVTNADGTSIQDESDYYPFGGERPVVNNDPNQYKFTGKERDTETGLDYFEARYFGSAQGKFTSPDPRYFQATAVIDPQRFNLYSYARNNPLKWVDPSGEALYLAGDADWLRRNALYGMAGGEDTFNQYFHIDNGQVVLNEGVDTSNVNAGVQLLLDQVNSSDNYLYFAGTSGTDAAALFQGTTGKNGKPNQQGKDAANFFTCGGGITAGCGTVVGTLGRPGTRQPAALANGDPVFAVIGYNENAVQTQVGLGAAGGAARSGLGQRIAPASLFTHESAENLAFRSQGNFNYQQAHDAAIRREAQIRQDLGAVGGFAGAEIRTTVPKK